MERTSDQELQKEKKMAEEKREGKERQGPATPYISMINPFATKGKSVTVLKDEVEMEKLAKEAGRSGPKSGAQSFYLPGSSGAGDTLSTKLEQMGVVEKEEEMYRSPNKKISGEYFVKEMSKNLAGIVTAGLVLATTMAFSDLMNEILYRITKTKDTLLAYFLYFIILSLLTIVIVYAFTALSTSEVAQAVQKKVGV